MSENNSVDSEPSEVAMWHKLSGMPDNVTDDGLVVDRVEGRRQQVEKDALRSEIRRLRESTASSRARSLASLASSYLLAGDVETARRYVRAAREALEETRGEGDTGTR